MKQKANIFWFRSRELSDLVHLCCMNALKCSKLDQHIANDHLNIDLKEMILLRHFPIHYKDHIYRVLV